MLLIHYIVFKMEVKLHL